jgi:putative two-component system response regulator
MARILIVDDEKSIRKTFEVFLSKEGHDVYLAENVPKALDIVKNNAIDLIITDIIMPRITGIEMLEILKEESPDIPIIIMTGEPTVETAKKSVKDNAHDYLIKPVNKSTLINTTNYALSKKELIDSKKILEEENQLYRENLETLVEKRTESLQKAVHGTISTIAAILESKDPYTAGHEKRVGSLAFAIAEKMNLSNEKKESIYYAGYLHDIGKLMVPSEILSKPGKLSKSEYSLVKDHVQSGFDLIKNIELAWPISEIVFQHHERIDGSGYPLGLKDEEISLEAKILAVSDVVEAMTTHRPYRPSFSRDKALEEIENNSGILYSEDVVKATVELFKIDKYEFDDNDHDTRFDV